MTPEERDGFIVSTKRFRQELDAILQQMKLRQESKKELLARWEGRHIEENQTPTPTEKQ